MLLEIKELKVNFKTNEGIVQAVRGLNLSLLKKETLCIVGESGSGKSVMCKAIMGILPDNADIIKGEIIYEENNLIKFKEKDFEKIRGRKIGMIFQDPASSLNPLMKIGKQITEALILQRRIKKNKAKEEAIKLLEEVGITEPHKRYNQYPFQLSGGMKQRVVIAISLAMDPEILICDEPTTALDVTIQSQILDLIKKIKEERNLSLIFITHDLGVVANMADRILVMYAGLIVEYGLTDEIFYDARHPYTKALLASMPTLESKGKLESIPGGPPNMLYPPLGDAFAYRNKEALRIDFKLEPPFFMVSETHYAKTWLLHPLALKKRRK